MGSRRAGEFPGTDRFVVRRRVGAGGMGVVYEAYDLERDTRVALKTIRDPDASTLYRFKKEFRALTDVIHPNLVKIHELVVSDEHCFYTMEFVDGVDFLRYVCPSVTPSPDNPLSDTMETFVTLDTTSPTVVAGRTASETEPSSQPSRELGPPIPETADESEGPATATATSSGRGPGGDWPSSTMVEVPDPVYGTFAINGPARPGGEAIGVEGAAESPQPFHEVRLRAALRQLSEALNVLHTSGRLHRDIKPSNVLVARRGRVVLLDFGLSTELDGREGHHSTTDGHIVGTVAYMSPEQAAGEAVSTASDWYSVGVMLYRALTGRLPYEGRSLDVMMRKRIADPPPPREINPAVPDDLDSLCVDLLRRDPTDRPGGDDVMRRLGGPSPVRSAAPPARSRVFLGREEQLARLGEAFTAVGRGQTRAVFLHGRSGAGKTALLQRFIEGLSERGDVVVLGGRCYEHESVAYKAIDTLIDSLTRFLRRLSGHESAMLMPRDVAALARVFPVLRRVDAVADAPDRSAEVHDLQELRRRAFGSLRELLARIGDRRPVVLAIDDLQWGDADSAALLCELLQPPDPPRLLLLFAYRSEYARQSPCLRMLLDPHISGLAAESRIEVVVEALGIDESRRLALQLLGRDDRLAEYQATMVARESRGSPFFVYELVEHLRSGGELDDRSSIRGSLSLDDVLWARIERLPTGTRDLLEALAVAGQPMGQADTIRAAGLGPEGFGALASLRATHLIRGTGSGAMDDVETYHDRIRETVVDHLDAARLRHWHERLATTLEESGRGDAQTLAVQFDAGGRQEKAGDYYLRAAREAAQALAFDRAAQLLRRAVELRRGTAEEHALRTEYARALADAGRSPEAAREYAIACEAAGPFELQELRRSLAFQLLMSGKIDEGMAVYRELLAHLGIGMAETPRQLLREMIVTRLILSIRGLGFRELSAREIPPDVLERLDTAQAVALGMSVVDWIRGSSFQSRSLLMALRAGEPVRVALSMGWEVVQSACIGRRAFRRTEQLIRRSRELAERLDNAHAIGMARLGHGAADFLSSRFQTGATISDEATSILRERCPSAVWERDTSQMFAAWALFYCGEVAELRVRCPRIAKEGRERGDMYLEATVNQFPRVAALLGDDDPQQARTLARDSIAKWSQRGFHVQHLTSFYGQMLIDLYNGDAVGAWRRAVSTWPELEQSLLLKIQHVHIDALQYRGRAALAAATQGEPVSPLLREVERIARLLDRQRLPWSDAFAAHLRAGIAAIRGDQAGSVAHLRLASDGFDQGGLKLYAAAARRVLGRLVGGDEGRALVARCDDWMGSQGIRVPEKMVRACASGFPE